MAQTKERSVRAGNSGGLQKTPTGIKGFDEITEGGLPKGRVTLISGGAGAGKTLFGLDFLVNGAMLYNEPGVFMSFEETEDEIYEDVASLNMDLRTLVSKKLIHFEHVVLEHPQNLEAGDSNLEGLFIRLELAIDSVGAKRVVLDSIESLFAGSSDNDIIRLEVKRLFRWFKQKQVTAVVTGEQWQDAFTRHGLEEFISDCIVLLDNRVRQQISTRRIRIIKYRGSNHGTNEYPFVIDKEGLSVIPISSTGLDHAGTAEKVSTGIASLDQLFAGRGYSKGSTVLVSGSAGTGKSSIATAFADRSCKRGERCLYLSYEESPGQLIQNMRSIGFELQKWVDEGLLKIVSTRPAFSGLESHLLDLYKLLAGFKPDSVVIDPITSLIGQAETTEIQSMLTRMIDALKSRGITGLFTSLVSSTMQNDTSGEIGVSSLIDTWIVVRELEEDKGRRRTRGLYIVKSRGTGHSSDVQQLILSDDGIHVRPMQVDAGASASQKKKVGKSVGAAE